LPLAPPAAGAPNDRCGVARPAERQRVGLVAGWGRLPIAVARSLKAQGCEVHCVGLRGHADPALRELCDSFVLRGVARLGQHIRDFQRRGIAHATLAGKVFKHRVLFGRFGWLSLVPDLRTMRAFFPLFVQGRASRSDDALLTVVVKEYARAGIMMAPATDFAPQLLARTGQLTRRGPTASQWQDIEFGWNLAKEMGRLDIGQSVAVKGRAVLAVEAIEGTDACIRRAGELCAQGGFTVVKVAKPQQDMRFDVPTIGVGTIETLAAAGGTLLAIEAGKTIVLDEEETIALADTLGLAVVAITGPSGSPQHNAPTHAAPPLSDPRP
jgi:hypothetical protein